MKKKMTSILAGLTTAALTLSLCATALAAPAGKKAVSATGKTASQVSKTITGPVWQRELDPVNGGIFYTWSNGKTVQDYDELPTQRPTWLPEGYLLSGTGVGRAGVRNDSVTWTFVKDEASRSKIVFTCYRPTNRSRGSNYGVGLDAAALRRDATVQGGPADFYQVYDDGSCNILVWEDTAGNLFWLRGSQDQATYEKIANSVKDVKDEPLPALRFGWMPEGFSIDEESSLTMPAIVEESWTKVTQASGQPQTTEVFYWFYSREALFGPTSTQPETVKINGVEAQYWPGNLNAQGNTTSVNGKVTSVTTSSEQTSTLLWMDPDTKISFRLEAPFDKDTLLRMAKSITVKEAQ